MEITIENFWYDLLLAIISAVLGTVFGVIIPKLLERDKKNDASMIDKQLVFTQIHVEQNQYIYNNTSGSRTVSQKSNGGQGMSDGGTILVCLLGSLLLIYGFLKYESQISSAILVLTVLLESTFLTTSYLVTKKCHIDKSIKSILLFNIFATLCSPILLYLMKNPLTNSFVNKEKVLATITNEGVVSLLNNVNVYGFLLYQALGVMVLFGFMLFTMTGKVHILSMVNLALGNRFRKVWRWSYKKTMVLCKSAGRYIGFGILLLIISFLFVSGLLAEFINYI